MAMTPEQEARIVEIDAGLRANARRSDPARRALLDEKVQILADGAAGGTPGGPPSDPLRAARTETAAGRADRITAALASHRWSAPDRAILRAALSDALGEMPDGAYMPRTVAPGDPARLPIATLPSEVTGRLSDPALTGDGRETAFADLDAAIGSLSAPAGGDRA